MADPTLGIPGCSSHPDQLEKWDKLGIPAVGMASTTLSKHSQRWILGNPDSRITGNPGSGSRTIGIKLRIPSWDPAVGSAPRRFPHYSQRFLPSFSILDLKKRGILIQKIPVPQFHLFHGHAPVTSLIKDKAQLQILRINP